MVYATRPGGCHRDPVGTRLGPSREVGGGGDNFGSAILRKPEGRLLGEVAPFVAGEWAGWPLGNGVRNLPVRGEDGHYVVEGLLEVREDRQDVQLVRSSRIDRRQEYYDTFDLEREPRDVCLYAVGANYVRRILGGFPYRSNVAVIPKEEIAVAFRRAVGQADPERKSAE